MNTMKEYIISIAAAAVISAVVSIITPEKWSKYVGVVTGLVVVLCIAQPIFSLLDADVFSGIEFQSEKTSVDGTDMLRKEIVKELETRVETDAQSRIKTEFMMDCSVDADVSVNEKGEITGVNNITVYSKRRPDTAVMSRLKEVYGVKEVKYGGYNENSEKSE